MLAPFTVCVIIVTAYDDVDIRVRKPMTLKVVAVYMWMCGHEMLAKL